MNYLEKKLKEKNISKQELAKRLGVNKNTITNYCKKTNFDRISADRLFAIANILGISCDELVYEVLGQKRITEKFNMNKEPENYVDIIRKIKNDNITDIVVTRKEYIEELVNYIDKLQEENKHLKEQLLISNNLDNMYNLYISKDKIRDKIEELKEGETIYDIYDNGQKYAVGKHVYTHTIKILQELLEEE